MQKKANYPCDMHTHTLRSDGNDTPLELLRSAVKAGLDAVAITDHDTPPPLESELWEYAEKSGITYIPGYEFSCDTWVDDVHICGYAMDWEHPDLKEEISRARNSKSEAYKKLCEILTEKGMEINWERDILNGRTAEEVERKHIFETIADKGYCPTWSDAKIMVRDDPELNVKRRKIDSTATIRLIHTCKGIAILSHPYLIDETVYINGTEKLNRAEYIERLIDAGLDGIEASYTYDKTSYKGSMTPEEIEEEIRETYAGRLLFSGGSDYHAGHKKGNTKVRSLGERGISQQEFEQIKRGFNNG